MVLIVAVGVTGTLVTLANPLLQAELVGGRDVIVLVALQTLLPVVQVEAEFLQRLQHLEVNRHAVEAHDDALHPHLLLLRLPGVLADVLHREPLGWVGVEDILEKVLAFDGDLLRTVLLASKDLLLERSCVRVFEGKEAADHGKQDDSTGPDVHLEAVVGLASHHFRSSLGDSHKQF